MKNYTLKTNTLKTRHYMMISIVAILLLWKLISYFVASPIKCPSPEQTIVALGEIITDKTFLKQVLSSVHRLLIGFIVAFGMGLSLGLLAGFFSPVYYLLKPIVLAQRATPTMAVILLSLIWLNREVAPILVGILVIFPIIYSAVVNGVRQMDKQLLEMCQVFGLSRQKKLKHLYLPSIQSSLMSVSKAAISLNVKIIIAAEVLSQPKYAIGTGFQMEKTAFNTAGVLAWAIIAVGLAGLFEYLISFRYVEVVKKVVNK